MLTGGFGKKFHKAKYEESMEVLCNPDRGFFQMFTVVLGQQTDYAGFESCLLKQESLVFLLVDIGAYKNVNLPQDALDEICFAIDFFAKQNKDIILRVAYDHQGQALLSEPALYSQVVSHVKQLARLVHEHADKIFVYQGILIGNWGEMHTSRFMGKSNMKELVYLLEEELEGKPYLAVRRPCFFRQLYRTLPDMENRVCRVGLYNDAVFGSSTDMGTYGETKPLTWELAWEREEELKFQKKLCQFVPCGGESVWGNGYIQTLSSKKIVTELKSMHFTYLNRLYDQKVLMYLDKMTYSGEGIFKGGSLLRYIEAHLGYRFVLRDVRLVTEKNAGMDSLIHLEIYIENTGFAPLYRRGCINLYVVDEKNEKEAIYEMGSLNEIIPGERKCFRKSLGAFYEKKRKLKLYIGAFREMDQREIYFGNEGSYQGRVFLGTLTDFDIEEVH